jgi:hypothetical protein
MMPNLMAKAIRGKSVEPGLAVVPKSSISKGLRVLMVRSTGRPPIHLNTHQKLKQVFDITGLVPLGKVMISQLLKPVETRTGAPKTSGYPWKIRGVETPGFTLLKQSISTLIASYGGIIACHPWLAKGD